MPIRSALFLLLLALLLPSLGGCLMAAAGGAAVGAGAIHDRRTTGTYIDDKRLYLAAYNELNKDKELALHNSVVIVAYNGVILLAGEVRTPELRQRAEKAVSGFAGTRRIVNELAIMEPAGFWSRRRDNTITAHAKAALLDITSLPGFDPTRVNVTTTHRVVYLMGLVTAAEADAVVEIVRNVPGVEQVVKVFDYVEEEG